MTREEALCRVKGYLTDIIPTEDYSEVEEIIEALEQQPRDDVINRKAVYEQINSWIGSGEYRYTNATYYLMKRIRDIPPVTLQQKIGHWIKAETDHSIYYKCSKCDCIVLCTEVSDGFIWKLSAYCPDCGAKMKNNWRTVVKKDDF